jgi:predicted Zn-dependent peptidase
MRERMGLAYEVYATLDFYAEIGVMSAMAAVGRGRAGTAVREMKRLLEETSHGFSTEEFARGKEALAAQIELGAGWSSANAARYAELTLVDQQLVTPREELDALENIRVTGFNDFVKENIRWDSAAVCAIGGGPALDAVRA